MALTVERWGRVRYAEALERQRRARDERLCGRGGDRLMLLEHPPVVTLGRGFQPEHLRTPRTELLARGVDVHEVARGGDVTWHGPGQLVGYLVVDLAERGARDVDRFLRTIEAALCDALGELGVKGGALEGMTGVFVAPSDPPRKLASIGLGLRRWVTLHGFALNVSVADGAWDDLVPCGLHQVRMTSVAAELGEGSPADLEERAVDAVERAFREHLP